MVYIEIEPDLNECVETKARKEYKKLSSLVMKGNKERSLCQRLELLRLFLETADFGKLRSTSERFLVKDKRVIFLIWEKSGKVACTMKV